MLVYQFWEGLGRELYYTCLPRRVSNLLRDWYQLAADMELDLVTTDITPVKTTDFIMQLRGVHLAEEAKEMFQRAEERTRPPWEHASIVEKRGTKPQIALHHNQFQHIKLQGKLRQAIVKVWRTNKSHSTGSRGLFPIQCGGENSKPWEAWICFLWEWQQGEDDPMVSVPISLMTIRVQLFATSSGWHPLHYWTWGAQGVRSAHKL